MTNRQKKNVTVLLEFGIPPYRDFLFSFLNTISDNFIVIHNGEKFPVENKEYPTLRCKTINLWKFKFYTGIKSQLERSDVIISSFNFWRPSCWLPVFFRGNREIILWGHIQGSHDNFLSRYFKKQCINRAHFLLSYTDAGKKYAVEVLGIDPKKILVLRNTLYVSNSSLSLKERKYFLYVGRLQTRKKLDLFIKSLKKLEGNDEILRIVGNGEYKEELIKLVEECGLSKRVSFFPGTFDADELKSHFESAIAYVSPSQLGLGIVHAFSYGVPVLTDAAERHGPEFEYCNNDNTFFYQGADDLRRAIIEVYSNKDQVQSRGEHAYNYYRSNLSTENMTTLFKDAIYSD